MTTGKKPRSKPAAKKKAAATKASRPSRGHDALPHHESALIDGIAARVEELQAELKAANQKLDYLVGRAAPLEGSHPIVEQAEQRIENANREGNGGE